MADTNVGNSLRLKAFAYSEGLPRQIITPDSLTLVLYDPSNVLVYTDNKPIPVAVPDPNNSSNTVTAYYFTLPGNRFTISTKDGAPYLAQVIGSYGSAPFNNSIPIKVA